MNFIFTVLTSKALLRKFQDKDDQNAIDLATLLENDIKKIRQNMWLIELLTKPAMLNLKKGALTHWSDIFR